MPFISVTNPPTLLLAPLLEVIAREAADGNAPSIDACVPRPLALLLMVDSTASMATVDPGQTMTRWEIITNGLPNFASSPENAGIFVGLDFFPEFVSAPPRGVLDCDVTSYESPNVPIGVLPGVNNEQVVALSAAVANRVVAGDTPTTPALQGAITSAAAWRTAHPQQDVVVVFLTDGIPNGCFSTVDNAAAAAAAGLGDNPSIKTYVVGVGPEAAVNLDPIATAGGGSTTATVLTTGDATALMGALNAIRASASGCPVGGDGGGGPGMSGGGGGGADAGGNGGAIADAGDNGDAIADCAAPPYDPTKVYAAGDNVTLNGKAYTARYFTLGNNPETSHEPQTGTSQGQPWTFPTDCAPSAVDAG